MTNHYQERNKSLKIFKNIMDSFFSIQLKTLQLLKH